MSYLIGKSVIADTPRNYVNINSTEDIYISELLSSVIGVKNPDLYEKITEEIIFVRFDNLSKKEFMTIIKDIDDFSKQKSISESQQKGINLWNKLVKPKMILDDRYNEN